MALRLGPAVENQKNSRILRGSRLLARNKGDLTSAVVSAGYYAKKLDETMFVYEGNSYGHQVWRVSYKKSEYLSPINNTGAIVVSVTPDLTVAQHEVIR